MTPIRPDLDEKLDWPNLKDVLEAQRTSNETPPPRSEESNSGWKDNRDVVWAPAEDSLLNLWILIAAHTGKGGHPSWRTTKATVESHFWWKGLAKHVESFVHSCIHCIVTESGSVVPRPLGHALHAVKPNELLYFDFCFMMPGEDNLAYVLILKDDHSGTSGWFLQLNRTLRPPPTRSSTGSPRLVPYRSEYPTVALIPGTSWFGSSAKRPSLRTTSPSRTVHGATEPSRSFCRDLLWATRALLSELHLPKRCWPSIMQLVQSALNNAPLQRLGNRCPLTAFIGLPQDTPLASIKRKEAGVAKFHRIDYVRALQVMVVDKLQRALDKLHKEVSERSTKKRQAAVDSHNRKMSVRS